MASITISPDDVATAANFLEGFLGDSVPEGDFTQGTALRDLTVGALAAVFAYLTADARQVRQLQSLMSVQAATGGDAQALQDAVVAILSNLLINPKPGSRSRGIALGHATEAADIFIPVTVRFTRSAGLVFTVDSDETYFIPQNQLIPVTDATGAILEYQFRIPLVAVNVGTDFDIDPGLFSDFDRFSPFVTRVENQAKFSGGKGLESVDELLARAPTAISVRNLINERSITAVLNDAFDEIRGLFIAGYGDPEMQRDRLDFAPSYLALHLGGHVDIYLLLDLVETTFTGTVGGLSARPDEVVCMFRDATVPDFVAAGVKVGDVIRVTSGLPVVPREFKVTAVRMSELEVDPHVPFPVATDENAPPTLVSYTIGHAGPVFNDVLSDVGGIPKTTGSTSRQVAHSGRVTLPGGPVMDILDVAILNPAPADAAYRSPVDGFIHFPNHVTYSPGTIPPAPTDLQTPIEGLQFSTIINNPLEAQSARMWMEIQVGTVETPARFDGQTLRVRYRTLTAFAAIDGFVRDHLQRTVAANQLPRGHNPVSLAMDINYRLRPTATATLDDTVIAQAVVDFINAFDTSEEPIDVSSIVDKVRETFPSIGSMMLPLTVRYTLLLPTGDLAGFETQDLVVIDPAKQVSGPLLDLEALGISDRTVRYLANTIDVTAKQVL